MINVLRQTLVIVSAFAVILGSGCGLTVWVNPRR